MRVHAVRDENMIQYSDIRGWMYVISIRGGISQFAVDPKLSDRVFCLYWQLRVAN